MVEQLSPSVKKDIKVNSLFLFLANCYSNPTRAMVVSWVLWLILFMFSPFYYTVLPSPTIVVFILVCIACFAIGDFSVKQSIIVQKIKLENTEKTKNQSLKLNKRLNRFIFACSILGILGAFLFVVTKLFLSGLDFSQGISGARIERANDVLSGFSGNTPVTTYIGLLLFPLGTVAFLVSLLEGNNLKRKNLLFAKLAVVSPVSVTLVTGGRGGILQLIIMFFSVYLIRFYSNRKQKFASLTQSGIYKRIKSVNFKWLFLVLVIFFCFYTFYIFDTRREIVQATDFYTSLDRWESYYGIFPAKFLERMVSNHVLDSNFLLNAMQTVFYLTSGPSVFTKLVLSNATVGPFYGQYQVALLASFFRKFYPSFSVSDKIHAELSQAGTLGLIPSSWGMMYADFGWIGTLCEAFILGCICRYIYFSALSKQRLGDKLVLAFVITSIVLNPIVSPLGFTDSFFTFLVFLMCRPFLNRYSSKYCLA